MHGKHSGHKRIWTIVACALVVLIALATGGVFSKYKESVLMDSASLTVSSGHLADTFTLWEHKAVQNSNGTYSLDLSQTVTANSYRVVPGVTLPKDPFFTVGGKSKVASYLYVEVIDNFGSSGLSYQLSANWQDLNLTGENGGRVFVYTAGGSGPKLLDANFANQDIYILRDNQVTVGTVPNAALNVSLRFHGSLAQASLANTAREVYIKCFGGGN